MLKLLDQPSVRTVVADQCMYGLVTHTDSGEWMAAKKPTRFATNSPCMASRLSTRCDRQHQHQPLMSGRAAAAAFYPLGLITEILRGMRDQADADEIHPENAELSHHEKSISMVQDVSHDVSFTLRQQDLAASSPVRTTVFPMADGTKRNICLSDNFRAHYKDEYTQEFIPKEWVEAAIEDEIQYFNQKVWLGVPLDQALRDSGAKVIGTRWMLCNKGNANAPDVRARLVAQEIATHDDSSFYAATPPLESKRMLLSEWATQRQQDGHPLKLSLSASEKHISMAHRRAPFM